MSEFKIQMGHYVGKALTVRIYKKDCTLENHELLSELTHSKWITELRHAFVMNVQ